MGWSVRWERLVRRHRRALAGACVAVAILALGLALRPPAPATRTVVVAARALPTGARVDATDLAMAAVPTTVALPGATEQAEQLVGRVLAAPVAAGEPVTLTRVATAPGSGWGQLPAGSVPLPVRFPDADAVALLGAGQHVDVLAATGPSDEPGAGLPLPARMVARDALVLAVAGAGDEAADPRALGASQGSDRAPLVVLAVTEPQALAIAGAAASGSLGFTFGEANRAPAPAVPGP